MPAWIWNRGRSKKLWFQRLCNEYDDEEGSLHDRLRMSYGDWALVAVLAGFLVAGPAILAILTAYYTVTVCLSCRSFTFLMFTICQFCLIGLWIWDIDSANLKLGFKRSPSFRLKEWRSASTGALIWWTLVILFSTAAVFFAIGGTLLQIIGTIPAIFT